MPPLRQPAGVGAAWRLGIAISAANTATLENEANLPLFFPTNFLHIYVSPFYPHGSISCFSFCDLLSKTNLAFSLLCRSQGDSLMATPPFWTHTEASRFGS